MPGPPPKGASSTVRCLSRAKPRMSTASSRQIPSCSALPASEWASGPGNIAGKSVSTRAVQQAMARSGLLVPFGHLDRAIVEETFRRIEHEAALGNVHLRHGGAGERHQHEGAVGPLDLEAVAG